MGAERASHGADEVLDAVQHGKAAAEHGWQGARQQVAHELDRLRKLGADADGEVGEPHPMRAIGEALAKGPADEVILATPRHRLAGLVAMDLPHRIHRSFGLPVTVLGSTWPDG